MKRLENNYIYSLAEVKRNIKELQEKPDTQSKAYQLQFQKQLEKQLNDILGRLQSKNYTTLTDYMNECYSQGYLGAMYDIAGQGIPIVSPIDEKLVVKACGKTSDDIKLINKLGTNKKLLKNQVLAEMQRGFSTSMTYSDMARNISARGQADMNRSKLIARTEGHRIQNESKLDAMIEAKKKGADVVKQWDSTMDGNTRPEHKELDGQIREVEEPFEVAGMKAQCPGGFGNAYMDCNCRCVMLERARWALDEDELEELQKRAEFFGLDKTADFEEFKAKYLNACGKNDIISVQEQSNSIIIKSNGTYADMTMSILGDLSDDDIASINKYISSDSYLLNYKLRNGINLTKEEEAFKRSVDIALAKCPTYEGIVYRSLLSSNIESLDEFYKKHSTGNLVFYDAFTSTSLSVYDDKMDIQMVIESKTGKNISFLNSSEQEVLFKRGSGFLVKKIDGRTIYLEEI